MKRLTLATLVLALVACTGLALAEGGMSGKAPVQKSITGEIIDTGCYLAHGARGEKHISCATKCIDGGMPMGLLTSNGTLYLITLNHDNADPYNDLKTMAGQTVTVTGQIMTRNGMKAIEASAVQAAGASK